MKMQIVMEVEAPNGLSPQDVVDLIPNPILLDRQTEATMSGWLEMPVDKATAKIIQPSRG